MVEVIRANRMRVEVDAAEVHDPRQLRGIVQDHLLSGPSSTGTQPHGPDPLGPLLGRALLEKNSPSAPFMNRFIAMGRPPAPRKAPSATIR